MSNNAAELLATMLVMVWLAFVFGTTAYVVFGLGHSGWWFVLAAIVALIPLRGDDDA